MTPVAAPDGVGVATLPSTDDALAFELLRTRLTASSAARVRSTPHGLRPCQPRPDTRSGGAGRARVLRLAHGRLTLDELVSGAWAAIGAGFPAACPVCDGPMSPNGSAPAACGNCGAELS